MHRLKAQTTPVTTYDTDTPDTLGKQRDCEEPVMRDWSRDSIVFISEYAAPDDFVEYASSKKQMTLGGDHTQQTRTEKLYIHSSALDHMPSVHAT